MHHKFIGIFLIICLIMTHCCSLTQADPISQQPHIDDYSKIQGKSKPIFVHCDDIGNHLNCILFCKDMGHTNGICGGDFLCNCF